MDVLKAMKNKLEVAADSVGGSDVEKKVKAATSLENWPATNTQLHELSTLTSDYAAYKEIMPLVWKRVAEPPRNWRTVYKTLVLIEHFLRYGSQRVVEETRDRSFIIRQLQDFHYEEDGKDRGSGIREKSTLIVDLLKDDHQLQEIRRTASQNLHKFSGISNSGEQRGTSKYSGGGSDSGFGGGSGAFASSSGAYDDYVPRAERERQEQEKARKAGRSDAPASSPYDNAGADEGNGEGKKKKKKKEAKEESDPYGEPAAAAASTEASGSKKKKKKKIKEGESEEGGATAEAEVKKKKKDKKSAPSAIAGPPGGGDDDGFGEFSAAPFASAAAVPSQPAPVAAKEELSFDNFVGSSTPMSSAPPKPAPSGDLIDMFASQSINGGWGSSSSSSAQQRSGEIDLMSGAPAAPKPQATPNMFDISSGSSSAASKGKSPSAAQPSKPAFEINDHNNEDAFSSFVAGHKPAPAGAAGKSSAPAAAAAPAKKGDAAWESSLVNLGGLTSAKAPAPGSAPAPFIPLAKGAAGSSMHDPFSHLGGAQQQQRQMQMQRPMQGQGFGGQMQQPGGFGMQQPGMQSGFGGGNPMGNQMMMGGGGGSQMGMMGGGGGQPMMGAQMGFGFPPQKADPNKIFF